MKNFSIKRMLQLMHMDWQLNRRRFLIMFGSLLLIFIVRNLAWLAIIYIEKSNSQQPLSISAGEAMNYLNVTIATLSMFIFLGFVLLLSSRIFADVHTQSGALDFLALPASRMEKFLARVVLHTLVVIAVAYVAYFINLPFEWLAARTLISNLTWSDYWTQFAMKMPMVENPVVTVVAIPWFTLCGLLFRRYAWVFGLIFLGIIMMALGFCSIETRAIIVIPTYVVLAIVCYILSYWTFCRLHVNNHSLLAL